MEYIVYCTRNNKNAKLYIGVHGTNTPHSFDGYLGNGIYNHNKVFKADTAFKKAVKKYKASSFVRITLAIFNTAEEAYDLEAQLVTIAFIKRRDTYNLVVGGRYNSSDSQKIPVAQYSMEGDLLKIFDSMSEAATEVEASPSEISGAVKGKYKTSKGYVWRSTKKEPKQHIQVDLPRVKKVIQYSKVGYRMRTWNSIKEAAKSLHCDRSSISAVCKGKRKSIGGYQWRYETDGLDILPPLNARS